MILIRNFFLVAFISLCGCSSTAKFAQIPTTVPSDVQNRLEFMNNTYTLAPPDVLAIKVRDNPDLETLVIIRPDGNINFPLLGDLYVADHTPLEVREKVWKNLSAYIRDLPLEAIEVQVTGFYSKKIYIYNEHLGIREIPYTGSTTLLSAIAQSGLLSRTATLKDIKVIRTSKDEEQEPKMLVVNLGDILNEGKGEKNIVLKENDIISIPSKLLAKVGFVFQDLLAPMNGMRGMGSFAESAMFNALGFAGPAAGWQGWMGQSSRGNISTLSTPGTPQSPFFSPGSTTGIPGITIP